MGTEVDVIKSKMSYREKVKRLILKLRGVKKRYYVIFGLLVLFFAYNIVSLRGFYYARNDANCIFGFMDWWQGHTTAINRSYKDPGRGYVEDPADIHDTKEATEWYGSILGTVVFMKWKWVGLHVGDYMILIDTWVPTWVPFDFDNHILGHPYYILHRYDSVKKYPLKDEKGVDLDQRWEEQLGKTAVIGEISHDEWLDDKKHWENNVGKYRRITIIFYCAILLIIVAVIVGAIGKRKRRRKQLQEMP